MRRGLWGYIFVSPWILIYTAFGLYPLLLSFYLTFFTYSFVRPEDYVFVGIGNWIQGIMDPLFWKSMVNILYNQVIFIALTNIIGLATALLLYKVVFGGRIFRTIYFMPVITSVVVLMAIGGYLAGPEGPVQANLVRIGLLKSPVFWKFDLFLPMPIIAVINSWKWFGVSTVIYLAGLVRRRHAVLRSRCHRWGQRLAAVLVDHRSGPAPANFLPAGGQRDQRAANVHRGFHHGV